MNFESLVNHISVIQDTLQAQAAHSVNLALTSRNWLIGCYIVEFEQHGEDRAAYGEQLLKKLEKRINTKGLNERRFREFRRLYLVYPQLKEDVLSYFMSGSEIRHTPSAELQETYVIDFDNDVVFGDHDSLSSLENLDYRNNRQNGINQLLGFMPFCLFIERIKKI